MRKLVEEQERWDRTDYYYKEGWQVLEERFAAAVEPAAKETVASAVKTQYLWDVRYIDAPAVRWRDADGQSGNGLEECVYYLNDANMNVTAVVDGTPGSQTLGEVLERYAYDPYGRPTFLTAGWTPRDPNASAYANEILYCGYRFDPETGMYQVRHRVLHPTLARWAQRDLYNYADGMNLMAITGSNPVDGVDPYGLQASQPSSQPTSQPQGQGRPCTATVYHAHRSTSVVAFTVNSGWFSGRNQEYNKFGIISCYAEEFNYPWTSVKVPNPLKRDFHSWLHEIHSQGGYKHRYDTEVRGRRADDPVRTNFEQEARRIFDAMSDTMPERVRRPHAALIEDFPSGQTEIVGPETDVAALRRAMGARYDDANARQQVNGGRGIGPGPCRALLQAGWDAAVNQAIGFSKLTECGNCRAIAQFHCKDRDSRQHAGDFCNRRECYEQGIRVECSKFGAIVAPN